MTEYQSYKLRAVYTVAPRASNTGHGGPWRGACVRIGL